MQYNFRYVVLSAAIMLLLTLSCSNLFEPETPVAEGGVLIPLAVGNYWAYRDSFYSDNSPIEGLTDSAKVVITNEFSHLPGSGDQQSYIWQWYYPLDQELDYKWIYWNGTDGVYILGGLSSADTLYTKHRILKYPVRLYASWEVPRLVYDLIDQQWLLDPDSSFTYSCVAIDSLLMTPIDSFRCVVFHHRRRQAEDVAGYWDIYDFYTPDIGLVAQITLKSYNKTVFRKRLLYDYLVLTN